MDEKLPELYVYVEDGLCTAMSEDGFALARRAVATDHPDVDVDDPNVVHIVNMETPLKLERYERHFGTAAFKIVRVTNPESHDGLQRALHLFAMTKKPEPAL